MVKNRLEDVEGIENIWGENPFEFDVAGNSGPGDVSELVDYGISSTSGPDSIDSDLVLGSDFASPDDFGDVFLGMDKPGEDGYDNGGPDGVDYGYATGLAVMVKPVTKTQLHKAYPDLSTDVETALINTRSIDKDESGKITTRVIKDAYGALVNSGVSPDVDLKAYIRAEVIGVMLSYNIDRNDNAAMYFSRMNQDKW